MNEDMEGFEIRKDGSVLTVVCVEELSAVNSPALQEKLISYKDQGVNKIVFDATNLTYISSSGVRVILYCRKYWSTNLDVVFVNSNSDVLDVLDLVGLRPYVTFVNSTSDT